MDFGLPTDSLLLLGGNLYGTTLGIGSCAEGECGTVFELTPPNSGQTSWNENVLFSFGGASGANPSANLIGDATGNLFGTTQYGGNLDCAVNVGGCGIVFELSPPVGGTGPWTQTTLLTFDITNGDFPLAGLAMDSAGNLYGTTSRGGPQCTNNDENCGCGSAFMLAPPIGGQGPWTQTVLISFIAPNGCIPQIGQGLIRDQTGNLYGTTQSGGQNNLGTVFELMPP